MPVLGCFSLQQESPAQGLGPGADWPARSAGKNKSAAAKNTAAAGAEVKTKSSQYWDDFVVWDDFNQIILSSQLPCNHAIGLSLRRGWTIELPELARSATAMRRLSCAGCLRHLRAAKQVAGRVRNALQGPRRARWHEAARQRLDAPESRLRCIVVMVVVASRIREVQESVLDRFARNAE